MALFSRRKRRQQEKALELEGADEQIGRASCRERV